MRRLLPVRPGSIIVGTLLLLAACSGSASPTGSVACREAEDGVVTITAADLAFDTACLALPAREPITLVLVNDENTEPHNVAIYTDSSKGTQLFAGEIIAGGERIEYDVPPLEPGTYYFECTVHPGMNGSVVVE